ncbi:hypothetical protein HMPREF9630_00252 [Peptoanaerobacter stomatis]|uniref:YycH protein n=1 Tax=Peptoanaerobacter stomatis TaxID=796937 RepID=V9HSK7_9FIRM|nr:hypothetical protein [Peptoanaerobacter stomatis]EHL18527.1 hypothetical protein HMPREF9630_00252 [Peptoanaerobacter stomatis]
MKKNVEMIKTLVLWILFLSSMALVIIRYNLIGHNAYTESKAGVSYEVENENITPSNIIIRINQYYMTQILRDKNIYYSEAKIRLINALSQKNSLKNIKESDYTNAKKLPNIVLLFDAIPADYIEKIINLKGTSISDIGYIKEICFLQDSQYVYIKTTEDFYELKGKNKNTFESVKQLSSKNYTRYYPKFENINDNENILLPLTFDIQMKVACTKNILDEVKIADIAEHILKDRFDFTSSLIQKNGDYFYSYNNGQEILRITSQGFIEYKKEGMENIQADLKISTYAMFEFLNLIGMNHKNIVISSVEKMDRNTGTIYKFDIRQQKDDIEVFMQDDVSDGYIEVSGDTVIAAKLYLRYPGEYTGDEKIIMEPAKALNVQIEDIQEIMGIQDVEQVIAKIQDIRLIYAMNTDDNLQASWRYSIGEYIFIINAFTGDLMNYGMVKI